MMQITKLTKTLTAKGLEEAKKFLGSGDVLSIKEMEDDCYEALVRTKDKILMPDIEIKDDKIDMHCQCCTDDQLCVHKVAILVAEGLVKLNSDGKIVFL